MRIIIDLQGAQSSSSRDRGIGRYTLAISKHLLKVNQSHEIIIALNGAFPETIEPIKKSFDHLLPSQNMVIWHALRPVNGFDESNEHRKYISELTREAFFESLNPDILLVSSLFEGFDDDSVNSIGRSPEKKYITATIFYDLIPLIQSDIYLNPNPLFKKLYMEKIGFLEKSDIFLSISESSKEEIIRELKVDPIKVCNIGAGVGEIFSAKKIDPIFENQVREKFNIPASFIMYSGATDERKNHRGLMDAYSKLDEAIRTTYQLVLVGKLPQIHKTQLRDFALSLGLTERDVIITDKVTDEELVALYNLCDLYVFPSWHEGFGLPALEALSCGAAVIGSNNTSIPEVIGREDALFNPHDSSEIAQKINEVLLNQSFREDLKLFGPLQAKKFSWEITAQKTLDFFEHHMPLQRVNLSKNFPDLQKPIWLDEKINHYLQNQNITVDINQINQIINQNFLPNKKKRLFIDVSELIHRDQNTGIQRVVRSILKEFLLNSVDDFQIIPVHANTVDIGYKKADSFTSKFIKNVEEFDNDQPIEFQAGDIFFGLDVQFAVIPAQIDFYKKMSRSGVKIYFMVHDLLPILSPEFFEGGVLEFYELWLLTIGEVSDGVITVSKSVADELKDWIESKNIVREKPLKIGWSHNGSDFQSSKPTFGLPEDADKTLSVLKNNISFLSVGTLEPRKGHLQMLEAFEILWEKGLNVNLVFVGKEGWNVENLKNKISKSPELGNRLFWLSGISDEYLEKVYQVSTCLICPSMGEGFGLPIVEGAQKGIPMIIRDIPVFKEVAGNNATYFSGIRAEDLVIVISKWIEDHKQGLVVPSSDIKWITWETSAKNLKNILINENWYYTIPNYNKKS
jgi:glycosyltransferase involved in cell wall biosynthesis